MNCVVMERIKFLGFVILLLGFVNGKPTVFSPPIIHNSGSEIIVNATNNLTLVCEGKEEITWTYPNNTLEGTYWSVVNVSTSQIGGKHFAMLTITNASFVDVDYYYCHAQYAAKDDPDRSDKIYVYVRDDNHLSVKPSEEIEFLTAVQHSTIILPCRPTSPDVTVNLYDINGEEVHNVVHRKHVGFEIKMTAFDGHFECKFQRDGKEEDLSIFVTVITVTEYVTKPHIEAPNSGRTRVGSTYTLNCTVTVEQNIYFTLNWITPNPAAEKLGRINATVATATEVQGHKQGSSSLTIKDVQPQDAGEYTCIIVDHTQKNNSFSRKITVFGENGSYINIKEETEMSTLNVTSGTPSVQWVVKVDTFPKADIMWYSNKGDEIIKGPKYEILFDDVAHKSTLKIKQITLNDTGIYRIDVNNGLENRSLNFNLIVYATPTVHIESKNYHIFGKNATLKCKAAGFPIPSVEWYFQPCESKCSFQKIPKDTYTSRNVGLLAISTLKMNATNTGIIKCTGKSSTGSDTNEQGFYVTDFAETNEGILSSVSQNKDEVAANSEVSLNCAVSRYNYTKNIMWYKEANERIQIRSNKRFTIKNEVTKYSYRSTLTINPIFKNDSAVYICETSELLSQLPKFKLIQIIVKDPVKPNIYKSNMNGTTIKLSRTTTSHSWHCFAEGIPAPTITWKKDGNDLPIEVNNKHITLTSNNTKLTFLTVIEEDEGTYTCEAENSKGHDVRSMKLEIIGRKSYTVVFVIVTLILGLFFLILVTVLVVKIKKEKRLRRELKIAGLANFEKGDLECLNPELGIDEQAELLPYDKKWEFPRDKLKLGKQLGSGAFGVVMKGEAFGIVEGETISTVAVKMVKRNADYTYIKALASELKIMVHLGKHLNVVNLLGACTKNVTKRELLVIVEYCRFGNLHNYLLRHRDDFVNQIDLKTGQIDTSIGEELLSRTMSVGSNQSGPSTKMAFAGVDYRATPNISSTTDSTVVCSPTGEDTMILSNNSSVQPEWRSNYRGDYNYKGNVRPTSTHDLLCWAFQVARGMEYLSSRKVMHGDLAARNILLAEDNIVKICDFGLAKSMYKSDNYKKKGDGPLPVKWMAVESIRDRVFSTQSDVWSFGIVLWEFFSLSRTPYPGMEADERLYNKLVDGYRMDQPDYATKEIYQIMMECWHSKPVYRPTFTKLADDLGNMLQDTVKKHYIDLNDPYIMMNTEQLAGHSDYLAMACSPDYGNLASPGHEYVNGKQYPEEQQPEASGYLPMDVFSPRSTDSIFNFDVAKNKNVDGEPASGVELLPMLHSTESDNESSPSPTKSFSNPNYQTNPNVDKDNTPKKDSIVSNSDNYINMPQQKSAIKTNSDSFSNPSYIHMNNKNIGEENEKSNYVNSHSRDWERPVV